jgi:hypothetical protein
MISFGYQTRNRFHNPFFISFIICVQILESITTLLMKEYKYNLLLIGYFNYFLNDRYFMNSYIIIWGILALFSQLLHCWKYYKNESPSYLRLFEMICGLVSPKSIGLIKREDVIHLLKKSKLVYLNKNNNRNEFCWFVLIIHMILHQLFIFIIFDPYFLVLIIVSFWIFYYKYYFLSNNLFQYHLLVLEVKTKKC